METKVHRRQLMVKVIQEQLLSHFTLRKPGRYKQKFQKLFYLYFDI